MRINIISTIEYVGRILAMVEINNTSGIYRTYFYRSTGTNVDAKGQWFPFSDVAGPEAIRRTSRHLGWIMKDLVFSDEKNISYINSLIYSAEDHFNSEKRLTAYSTEEIPFNIKEVSKELFRIYSEEPHLDIATIKHPICEEDAAFINTWLTKGLVYNQNKPSEEEVEKLLEQEILMSLALYT